MQKVIFAVVVVLAVMVGLAGTWQWWQLQRALAALPVNTRMGGDFVLPSTLGSSLDTKALRGKVVLLNFGFTSCPDVCPTVLARLKQTLKALGDQAGRVQVVFVSFDPERDSLAHLKAYLAYFDPSMVGATGSEQEIAAVARQYGVVHIREEMESAAGYGFSHSDYIYLIDTAGRLRKLYDARAGSDEMAADARVLLREGSGAQGWLPVLATQ